jgi:hypothetical protein
MISSIILILWWIQQLKKHKNHNEFFIKNIYIYITTIF